MSEQAEFRDSLDKTREAFRRVEPPGIEPGVSVFASADDARRDAVRAAVADIRSGIDPSLRHTEPLRTLHPFFQGLLDTLPQPGEAWHQSKRERWLETARNIFALLYLDEADAPRHLHLMPRDADAHDTAPSYIDRQQEAQSA